MQQEAWGRRALEDRIVTGSKDLEQLRQAASRYWTEAQDKLTTQTTKLAQLQEANESYAQREKNIYCIEQKASTRFLLDS